MNIELNGVRSGLGIGGETPSAGAVAPQAAADAVREIAPLIAGGAGNLSVSRTQGGAGAAGVAAAPEVEPADEAKAGTADLEALIAYLQMDSDEKMTEVQRERVESLKGQLKSAHDTQMAKIDKSIEEAKKQEQAAKASRVFGWLGAIFAVAIAVVMTITTGGAAAGFAIAGATLAVSSLVMSETGLDKKLMKAMADSIQENFGCSKQTAQAWAQGIYGAVELVLGLACAIGGGVSAARSAAKGVEAAAKVSGQIARISRLAMNIGNGVMQTATLATTAATTATGYQAGMAGADASEAQTALQKLQQFLEESEEDLQEIVEKLASSGSDLLAILESKTDTLNKIASEIGSQNA